MIFPTAYIEIQRIKPCRNETVLLDGYAWDTDEQTRLAYLEAKNAHAVPFKEAAYLVDFWERSGDQTDTFPISEAGYKVLTNQTEH